MRAAAPHARWLVIPLLLAACTDQPRSPTLALPPPAQSDALMCVADVEARELGCDPATDGGVLISGGARMQIIGGQGINVRLASSNVRYDSAAEIMRVDVTVQNLTTGILGSYHGDDVAGIQVFFNAEPVATAGAGEVAPANTDGAGAFTGLQQPYYKYAEKLGPGETTQAHTWEFSVPRTVKRFGFNMYVEAPLIPAPTPPEYGIWQQIVGGGGSTCGMLVDGRAFCWGRNFEGALGYGGGRNFTDPVAVTGGLRFTQVATSTHSCGVTTTHQLYCWGTNWAGEIGAPPTVVVTGQFYGNTRHNPAPTLVLGGIQWSAVDVGAAFTCGLDRQGRAYCWGSNGDGQLGTGDFSPRTEPAPVAGDHRFTTIQTGSAHACGLTQGGDVWCWGSNRWHQAGTGSAYECGPDYMRYACNNVPVRAESSVAFTAMEASGEGTCALAPGGVAYCWGKTIITAPGDLNPPAGIEVPTPVDTPERFAKIAMGANKVCGVRQDGRGFCWGGGTGDPYGRVVAVAPAFTWRELRPGWNGFRCGVARDTGEGYCWGEENLGQWGNGGWHEEFNRTDPQPIAALHVRDMPPQAGFTLGVGGREVTVFISEPLWNHNSPIYADDDFGLVKFYWSFGDGATAEGRLARHTYARNGTYPVTLTVEDTSGQRAMHTEWATVFIWEGE